jgi:Flp pilus assembly protein TadD
MSDHVPSGPSGSVPSFLAGGGEAGTVVRAFDWSKTSLGAAHAWPSSLKTTVGTLLHSRHPMVLWWGRDLIQSYNDAMIPSLGPDKHPAAMGQRGADCWQEIWPIIWPQIDDVMTRGKATWNEDHLVPIFRNDRIEEVYWTYGYSPVIGDGGDVDGTLVVCTETTARVIAQRRLETARALLEATAAHPQSAALHFENGRLLESKNQFDAAAAEISRAIELRSSSPEYYLELSRVLQKLNRTGEQRQALETAIKLDPGSAEAHFALANLARRTGDTATSNSEFEKVRQLRQADVNRDLALGALRAGVTLARRRDFDGAILQFRKALEIDPQLAEAHFNLAGALLEKGEAAAAIDSFRAGLKLVPHWPDAHYQLGKALLASGRRQDAIVEFRTALAQDPAHEPARQALAEASRADLKK